MRAFLSLVLAAALAAAVTIAASPQKPKTAPVDRAPAATGPDQSSPSAAPMSITGTIVETMDAGGYTYMKLKTPAGEMWSAVNQAKVQKGQTVTIATPMLMENFESKTLKRKFDKIVFGTLAAPGSAAAAPPSGLPPGHPATSGAAANPPSGGSMAAAHASAASGPADAGAGAIKVAKAEGASGRTVSELWAQRTALKGKEIAVRGKIVKFTPEVMGKNWIHLRDGSGTHGKKDDDITVTTTATAQIGDVVLVRGTVKTDRDLGAGYTYPVIIEDAKLSK